VPQVEADRTLLVVAASQPVEQVVRSFGAFRVRRANMALVTMCESPFAGSKTVEAVGRALSAVNPRITVALTVFRPDPETELRDRRVFLATTCPPEALPIMSEFLEENHGCTVVGASGSLANRKALAEALDRGLGGADVLVTEIKAAAIDVAVPAATRRGVEVVFMNNRPLLVGGDVVDLEDALVSLCERRSRRELRA
jgi:cyclic 2,3-diphosphoglycerate synthetase